MATIVKSNIDFDGMEPMEKKLLSTAARLVEALRRCPPPGSAFTSWEEHFYDEVVSVIFTSLSGIIADALLIKLAAGALEHESSPHHRVHAIVPSAMAAYNESDNTGLPVNVMQISINDPRIYRPTFKEMPEVVDVGENKWWTDYRE